MLLRPDADELADPATVAMPRPTDREGTRQFLESFGAPLAALPEVAGDLVAEDRSAEDCAAAVAALGELGEPTELSRAAATVPDAGTAAMAQNVLSAIVRFLPSCRAGDPSAGDELAFAVRVFERRLERLGVAP